MRRWWLWLLPLALLLAGLAAVAAIHGGVLSHNPYDQHTRQALAWSQGRITIEGDLPWLEIANYQGRQYVSFPPTPSLLIWPLSLPFGEQTPNNLLQLLLALIGLLGFWRFFEQAGAPPGRALCFALGLCLGSAYLWLSLTGAVWFLGQISGCVLAIWGLNFLLFGSRGWHWAGGALLLALAVGARPFYAFLFPLAWLWPGAPYGLRLRAILLGALPVALALAAYNQLRFDHPLEFGHNYIPAFSGELAQFSLDYLANNWRVVFSTLPSWREGRPYFSLGGNAIWLVAPVLLLAPALLVARLRAWRKALWLATLLLCWFPLLIHQSNGFAQWGYRYMVDLLPLAAVGMAFGLARWRHWAWTLPVLLLSISINVLGAYIWYAQPQTLRGEDWSVSAPLQMSPAVAGRARVDRPPGTGRAIAPPAPLAAHPA